MAFHRMEDVGKPGSLGELEDTGRDLAFRLLGTGGMGSVEVFVLTWKQRRIPVEAAALAEEPRFGRTVYLRRGINVGFSVWSAGLGAPEYTFRDETERTTATDYATEALLAFGFSCDGLEVPDGHYRAILGNKTFRLSDFDSQGR